MRAVRPTRSRWLTAVVLLAAATGGALLPAGAQAQDQAAGVPYAPPLRLKLADASGGISGALVIPPSLVSGAADVDASRTVTLRGAAGTRTARRGGTSLRALLAALGLSTDGLRGVELTLGGSRKVVLTAAEVRDGFNGDDACLACQATLDTTSRPGVVSFLRPSRGATDQNADDELIPRGSQSLIVTVFSDRAGLLTGLTPNAPRKVRVGDRVEFRLDTASLSDPTITWFFGDGTMEVGGPRVTHTFTGKGTWPVGALIRSGDRFGASVLPFEVLRAKSDPQAEDPKVAPTPTPTPAPTGTPGASAPPGTAATSPATGPTAPLSPAQAPPTSPLPPTPAPTPTTTADDAEPDPLVPPTPGSPLTPIQGVLASSSPQPAALAGALTAAEALAAAPDAPTTTPPPPADDDEGPKVAGSAVSGMLLFGLLSAGALTERRRARRATDLLR